MVSGCVPDKIFGGPLGSLPAGSRSFRQNADLILTAAQCHIPHGALVADVTYGGGVFWQKVMPRLWFELLTSDIHPRGRCQLAASFTALPYRDACFDVLVLDPPYLPYGGRVSQDTLYRNTARSRSWRQIMTLYRIGIAEACRVLKPDGQLWVKGMDLINGGVLNRSEARLRSVAEFHGFRQADRFEVSSVSRLNKSRRPSFLLVLTRD